MKIARLSVDQAYENRGIGTIAILFAMKKLLEINKISACRFITVDAKSESIQFYKKKGFEVLKEREKGTLPMYYDMIKQIKISEENKGNPNMQEEQQIL